MPRDVNVAHPRAEEVPASANKQPDGNALRHLYKVAIDAPVTHLLSNSRYSVMLTAAGGGYSRWHDIAVSRWREDPTLDPWGSALFVRDHDSAEPYAAMGLLSLATGDSADAARWLRKAVAIDQENERVRQLAGRLGHGSRG